MDGQLWGWNDASQKTTPSAKLALGMEYFTERFGYPPTRCLVRPELAAALSEAPDAAALELVPHNQIPVNAFYFVVEG